MSIFMFETQKTALGLDSTRIVIVTAGILIAGIFAWKFSAGGAGLWYAWAGLLAILLIRGVKADRQRTKLVREFAARMGFKYLGDTLPRSFPIQYTSSKRASSITRALAGARKRMEIVLFDCTLGHGKGRFGRTVVAVRGEPSAFGWARFAPGLEAEQVHEWTIVYGSRRLLSLEEIEALIEQL